MAKLKDIDLPEQTETKAKSAIPVVYVDGEDVVARYNEAKTKLDDATATMNELKPTLQKAGLEAVFKHNCENAAVPSKLISSVNLKDKLPDGADAAALAAALQEVCMFTWMRKDTANDPKQVEAKFNSVVTLEGKKANINNYAEFEVVASFNTEVFKVNGKFNQERYDAYIEALKEVSERFEVEMPLTCGKVLKPKADFHDRRWKTFDLDTNLELHSVLPTQCNLKPIRPVQPDKAKK